LHRTNPAVPVGYQIIAALHEIAILNIWHDHALACPERRCAGTTGIQGHSLPEDCRLRIKSAKRKQNQLADSSGPWFEELHARVFGTHDGHNRIHNLLVQRFPVSFLNQLRTDILQQLQFCIFSREF
jgi:hypothetical protein